MRLLSFDKYLPGFVYLLGFIYMLCIFAISLFIGPINASAQIEHLDGTTSQSSGGLAFVLTNSGFGLGLFLRDSLNVKYAFIAETKIVAGKDEREVAFFDRFGRQTIPGKANYLLLAPVNFGTQMRIFSDRIEDSFRPFVQISGGPAFGWEYPYFDDCNGNGIFETEADCNGNGVIDNADEGERRLSSLDAFPRGTLRIGAGGSVGAGAYFGYAKRGILGLRIEYSVAYFFRGIQLLEETIRPRQYAFGTPTVSIFFGPLF